MKVSVLINNYNYARFVGQAIDTALAQTHPDLEVIVVDDGSTDGSRAIIEAYGTRIRPVFQKNGGQAAAINSGFAYSKGDIIMLLDADGFLHPEAATKIVAAWREDTDVLHHRLRLVNQVGAEVGYIPPLEEALDEGDVLPKMLESRSYCAPPTSGRAYSRRLLDKLLPIKEKEFFISADLYFHLKVPFFARIQVLNEILGYYRFHGSNAYGSYTSRRQLKRSQLVQRCRSTKVIRSFFNKCAREQNYSLENKAVPEGEVSLFCRLLLARSRTPRLGLPVRITMVGRALRACWREKPSISASFRQSILLLAIGFAPRSVVARLYPTLFV